MAIPMTRLLTSDLVTLNALTLGTLRPYQLRQIDSLLSRVNWGDAGSGGGMGSESDNSGQPTLAQIATLLGSNNP